MATSLALLTTSHSPPTPVPHSNLVPLSLRPEASLLPFRHVLHHHSTHHHHYYIPLNPALKPPPSAALTFSLKHRQRHHVQLPLSHSDDDDLSSTTSTQSAQHQRLFTSPHNQHHHLGTPADASLSDQLEATGSESNQSSIASQPEVIPRVEVSLLRHSPLWTVVLCIAYLIVFFLGLIGNSSVLWVIFILRRKSSRHSMFANCNKVFNGLIGNLALADLLVIIFCLPATLISNVINRKLFLAILWPTLWFPSEYS